MDGGYKSVLLKNYLIDCKNIDGRMIAIEFQFIIILTLIIIYILFG